MKRILLILFFIVLSFSLLFSQSKKKSPNELPERYRKWLEEEVVYIISKTERDVFLQLETDRERDLFIEAFWKHRDPTPGTPENEFKTEHYRRINYANFNFGRGVPKPGWKTDRGKIYIILGEPRDIERYTGESEIYNTEVWFYQGLTQYGLPPGFNLVFFQKGGVGEYVLYSPTADGPQALMTSYFGDQADYLAAFQKLKEINPTLAQTSMSLIPGESAYYGRPSLSSDILLQNVMNVPQKQFEDKYAQKFLAYKDIVEVEYTANYIDNDNSVKILRDPSGIYFVNYVIELSKFSVQEYERKYSTHLKLNGNLTDEEGKIIYQYESSLPISLDEAGLKSVTYRPFNLYDMFPVLPGKYKFSVILKNEVSKEFTTFEKEIIISEDDSSPRLSPLVLGYKAEASSSEDERLMPFKIGGEQIYHEPKNIYLPQDTLYLGFQVFGLSKELKERGIIKYEFLREGEIFKSLTRKISEYSDQRNILEEFSLNAFPPSRYRIKVVLLDGEQELASSFDDFDITPVTSLPRPWVYNKKFLPASDPAYDYILGKQYFSRGDFQNARQRFEKAFQKKPDSIEFALALSQVYSIENKFSQVKETLLPFVKRPEVPYQVYFLLGKSFQALGEYSQAIYYYDEAISHFGINFYLLNLLGECYFKIGSIEEALAAWKKSLEINPDQPEIKKLIESIKK